MKLLDAQAVIDELLEELEAAQKKLATDSQVLQEKNKSYIKVEQPSSKVKIEHRPTVKSLFHGTTLAALSTSSACVLDTSVASESSEDSYYDC
jgi:hypothetical protein